MSKKINIGWYEIEELWLPNGAVNVSIKDRRTNMEGVFLLYSLEEFDKLIRFLDENRQLLPFFTVNNDNK